MSTPLLSIVIPTFGRAEPLYRLLAAVEAQTLGGLEVLIVDQNPPGFLDEAALAAADLRLTVLQLSPANAAAARNLGYAVSLGRYVLFLDDDELPHPEFCAHAVAAFEQNPEVRCLLPVVYLSGAKEAGPKRYRRRATGRTVAGTPLFEVTTGGAGGICFERRYFRRAGGFDELLFAYAGKSEDKELVAHMRRRGMRVWCDPTLFLLHDNRWPGGCALRTRTHRRVRLQAARAILFQGRIRTGPPFRLGALDLIRAIRYVVASSRGRPGGWIQLLRRPGWHGRLLLREVRRSRLQVEQHAAQYANPAGRDHLQHYEAIRAGLEAT